MASAPPPARRIRAAWPVCPASGPSTRASAGRPPATGVGRIGSLLERHSPGFVCILYGINDLTFGRGRTELLTNLRAMVQAAKGNKSVPILATLLPTYDSHGFIAGEVVKANDGIRQLARDEGARLCDLEQEFGANRALIQPDGLHPSDSRATR
jgi:lysophospholipase L1-like esterase